MRNCNVNTDIRRVSNRCSIIATFQLYRSIIVISDFLNLFFNFLFIEKIYLRLVAMDLPMGYSRFRKLFKALTGFSPNQYILNLRLEEAKKLLKISTLSINEIAHRYGFESVPHFCKFFHQKNYISASQFRNKMMN